MYITILTAFGFPELVLTAFFGIIPLGLLLFCLFDILKGRFDTSMTKKIWVFIVLLLPVLGSLLYLFVGRDKKIKS